MSPAFSVTALRSVRFVLAIFVVLLVLALLAVHQTRAQTTITVADGDAQGLITAIEDANSSSGSVTIELATNGEYVLTAKYTEDSQWYGSLGLPSVFSQITIEGNGATIRRGQDSDSFRIFEILPYGDLHLMDLIVSGGEMVDDSGGGILVIEGRLTLTGSSIINNVAGSGGGIANILGDVMLINSTISGNEAEYSAGGILHHRGNGPITEQLTLLNTTVSGNTAGTWGGGISNRGSRVVLVNSTVSGNTAESTGGGIATHNGEVTLTNSTVSGNKAHDGGGIHSYVAPFPQEPSNNEGDLTLTFSTITDNEAVFGSGIHNLGNLMLTGSIVAGNMTTPGNGTIVSNIDGGIDSNVASFVEDYPWLGPLQDNGGPTETHLPLEGSPVLDQIPAGNHGCGVAGQIDTDQRSVPRPQGTHCDIGAVERFAGFDHLEHIANPWFWATWARTDLPVRDSLTARTWMWGPGPFTTSIWEPYSPYLWNPDGLPIVMIDLPEEEREVIYFDKARMEINDPEGDTDSIWFVTNGLLVIEMITGNRQFGDDLFGVYEPSQANVAGDADDMNGPTYASFQSVLDAPAQAVGTLLTEQIARSGNVTSSSSWGAYGVTVAHVDPVTEHGIAGPIWEFMNSQGLVHEGGTTFEDALFANPFYATGRPVTEAYWAEVKVAGAQRDVLMQCFERRCLTYTPGNSPGFVVEAGNVGQHYYYWRYIQAPD